MTPEEFKTKQASTGGKWIKEPGTYSLIIKGVEIGDANQYDSQWVDAKFIMENEEGQLASHFVVFPTTAERSYLFGSKKSLGEYNKLEAFLRGFGVSLDYTTAIFQIEKLFSDPEKVFVGKTLTVRMGYTSNHTKFVGKDGEVSQYQICDKSGAPVVPTLFAGFEAADAYAKQNNMKLQGFPKILEVVSSTTASIIVGAPAIASALPF